MQLTTETLEEAVPCTPLADRRDSGAVLADEMIVLVVEKTFDAVGWAREGRQVGFIIVPQPRAIKLLRARSANTTWLNMR